jgi:hypothetical protein
MTHDRDTTLPAGATAMLVPWSRPPADRAEERPVRSAVTSRQLLRLTGLARS